MPVLPCTSLVDVNVGIFIYIQIEVSVTKKITYAGIKISMKEGVYHVYHVK